MVPEELNTGLTYFLGTDIEVYGANTDRSIEGVQIQFRLDNGPPLTFNNPVPQVTFSLVGNIKLFAQAGLEQKNHTLTAALMNNGEFMLDYILVTPGVNPPNASETSTSGPSAKTSSDSNPELSSSPSAGSIAGGAVGGVLGLLMVLFIFWLLHKRRPKQDEGTAIEPPEADPCMSLSLRVIQCSC
jgi:hypothetical protein